jgi:pyruvate, water dikinase
MELLKKLFRHSRQSDIVGVLKNRIATFRSLVDRNNRVLELIADAGEKLGGEFIFDNQYLKTLAMQLQQEVSGVVYDLSVLTDNEYPELAKAFQRIQAEVRNTLDARVAVPLTDYVIPLDQAGSESGEAIGQKMARLAEIRKRLGCKIPDGFVVTSRACRTYFEAAGISPMLEEWAESEDSDEKLLKEKAARLQAAILETPIPRAIEKPMRAALKKLRKKRSCQTLAVRSSASDEDSDLSFAGLYATQLGVPFNRVDAAFREVVASVFSPEIMMYRRSLGTHPVKAIMAVGCQCMIDARAAGVIYTLDPTNPEADTITITATAGLGKPVVDGTAAADIIKLSRHPPYPVLSLLVAEKKQMLTATHNQGIEFVAVPEHRQLKPCIAENEMNQLAHVALQIERYMKRAQDIEWAIDQQGTIFILQARTLQIMPARSFGAKPGRDLSASHRVMMQNQGTVACRGIGAGVVVVLEKDFDPNEVPQGAILVARASSPRLAAAMLKAGAVITDLGTSTGHLATIARELRVPMIVHAQNATDLLRGVAEATVDAEDNIVYEGIVHGLIHDHLMVHSGYEEAREFRLLRRLLNKIAPLSLNDAQSPQFKASNCETYHDIIRFAHEKAVLFLTEGAYLDTSRKTGLARPLQLDVPLDLILLDLGGGLQLTNNRSTIQMSNVTSVPLLSLLEGLLMPGVWSRAPVEMDLDGFMSSATRGLSLAGTLAAGVQQNLAIISNSYLHMSLKLGYHFNIVDCYLTETSNDNFIYFRFAGGVTEVARRTRRAQLLSSILEKFDFVVERKADLVVGRIKTVSAPEMKEHLRMIGRLIGFTRQLDILLRDDASVESCIKQFLDENYQAKGK